MKITTTKFVTEEYEISVPYFSKEDNEKWYCILDKVNVLSVHFMKFAHLNPSVRIKYDNSIDDALKATKCTASEFMDAYQRANDYLSEQFENMRDFVEQENGITVDDLTTNEGE